MKKFVPLIIIIILILYGIFSSYKKKIERNPQFLNHSEIKKKFHQ